jgi:AcrR family transcriptional regulator
MARTLDNPLRNKPSSTTEKGLGRAHGILRAARTLLARDGHAGLSMRAVAQEAGMALSNVQHYYASRDLLLEALLLNIMDEFQAKMDRIAAEMRERPRLEQFMRTMDMFLDEITEPETHAIFFELWALASRNPFASTLMDIMVGRERKTVYNMVRGLNPAIPDEEAMQRAILMVGQVQGLMLFRLDKVGRPEQFLAVRASLRKVLLGLATQP